MRGYFRTPKINTNKDLQAYIIGLALGDGNLSNPNGRAVRLRITCDKKYPKLLECVASSLHTLLPQNRVNTINRRGCIDVSVYSNQLTGLLAWRWDNGPKDEQNARVPLWIKKSVKYTKLCLRGLFQTDGSQYKDRGYATINFVNTGSGLTNDVFNMMKNIGYSPNMQKLEQANGKTKHTVRLSKDVRRFIKDVGYWKA